MNHASIRPTLCFIEEQRILFQVDAELFPCPRLGESISLIQEDGNFLGTFLVDEIYHNIPVRQVGESIIPLIMQSVTIVKVLRVEEKL